MNLKKYYTTAGIILGIGAISIGIKVAIVSSSTAKIKELKKAQLDMLNAAAETK